MSISTQHATTAVGQRPYFQRGARPQWVGPTHHAPRADGHYCTSEQMDLLRQVFAEADHRAMRMVEECSHAC